MEATSKHVLSDEEKIILDNIVNYLKKPSNKERMDQHYFSVMNENGIKKINDIYEEIDEDKYKNELMSVSVVVLTANYYESEILNLNAYNSNKESGERIKVLKDGLQLFKNDHHITKAYIMQIGKYRVLHLHAPETGSNTPCGSSDLVRYVNNCDYLDPSCIISFGICYGTNCSRYSLGDTIIANKIYPWSIGQKIYYDRWAIKNDDYIIDLRDNAAKLYNRIQNVAESAQDLCPDQKVKMGNLLTGEAVVSSERFIIEAIQNAYTCEIIGGEMEGYGLAKECIYYGNLPCVILKAICDWGAIKDIDNYIADEITTFGESYKDRIQAYTSYCAFKVLNLLFLDSVFEEKDILASAYRSVYNRYIEDRVVQKDDLFDYIDKYLTENHRKYGLLVQDEREKMKKRVFDYINQYLIKDKKYELYSFKI